MIILLNGISSSGKSTLTQSLQQKLGDGWISFSMDGYLSMLGPKYCGLHPDNPNVCKPNDICYAKQHTDGSYEIIIGERCDKLYQTIPAVIALMAEQGFHIIVDSFITTLKDCYAYQSKLTQYGLLMVYLHAPIEIIERREVARGDRLKGSARHWLNQFECDRICDLSFDTSVVTLEQITQTILQRIH